ncbi:MAG: hypothetical protein RR458_03070, partial [Clostridia bacterium]
MLLFTCMATGVLGGMVVGLCTPFIGMLLGFGGMIAVVPFIAVSNAIYILVFAFLCKLLKFDITKKVSDIVNILKGVSAVIVGAGVKFLFLYFVVLQFILPLIMAKMPPALTVMLGITQLFTALIGGAFALAIAYPLSRTNVM